MPKVNKLDKLNKKILSLLVEDARMPYLEIARKCGVSGAAIHQRMAKLKEMNVIEGTRIMFNSDFLGYKTKAFVGVILEKANLYPYVQNELSQIKEITECHFITGDYTIFIKIFSTDNVHLKKILIKIHDIKGVTGTDTFISIEQAFDREVQLP